MSAIFGGSKSKQQSQSTSTQSSLNQAYPALSQAYMPTVNIGNEALGNVKSLLGLGGNTREAAQAFGNYINGTDYDFTVGQGQKAINTNAATRGLLGSGSTLKALQGFGQNTAQKYFGDYIARLLGLSSQGLQAGSIIAGAGNTANSQSQSTSFGSSSSSEGIVKAIGAAASAAAASDRRLKKDIVKVGQFADGLGVYEWTYNGGGKRYRGHMADEIQKLRPWALGPEVNGFMTVNYAEV